MDDASVDRLANGLLAALDGRAQAPRAPDMDMGAARQVAERVRTLREARGERVVGRKIGFTNTTIWPRYGVDAPMWNYVWSTTVADLADASELSLGGFHEPRLEPEIVLHLATAPTVGMDDAAPFACIDWVAHGFEVVQSVYPGWRFTGPESAAAFGLHGALRIGPRHTLPERRDHWATLLSRFGVRLFRDGERVAEGHASHVLGGPLRALAFLVDELARYPGSPPLEAGEVVTTGTLTDAQPLSPGESWWTELDGIPIEGIRIETRE